MPVELHIDAARPWDDSIHADGVLERGDDHGGARSSCRSIALFMSSTR